MFRKIIDWLLVKYNEVFFVGATDKLPPPLSKEEELKYLVRAKAGDEEARNILIEHNLRLVVFLAKKYENTTYDIEDLVSIGSIGLIKGINTYKIDKNIKLATYASRCIANEILMYIRKNKRRKTEISLEDARKINKELNLGDSVEVEIVPRDFGRIAAQTAKQVIIQKLRETERNMIFNEYNERKGEIVTGLVQKADNHIVVLDLGKLEGIMLSKDQIPTEHYKVNDKIKAYVVDVERGEKGAPQAIVSRTHPDFVRKLLEFEIPEIYEGLIEIKSVARDPGQRCKVAVYSQNENIDPVGSCVGQKGIRIQNVINELNGEKIDVIEWNPDPSTFLASALLPAQIMAVDIKEEEKFAQVIVQDDQLSLAIGKAGQNARLAAKLTNWKIDIKSESQFRELLAEKQKEEE